MRAVIQRVKRAKVLAGAKEISNIAKGLLLFVGIGKNDNANDCRYLAKKIANLRIFEDDNGKMNLSIKDINGEILSIPQFTLYANTKNGNRPGFDEAALPNEAEMLWQNFNTALKNEGVSLKEGQFAAHMEVELINDGPVTIFIDSKQL